MNRILLLWLLIKTFHYVFSTKLPQKLRSFKEGDLFLGGFFPIHASSLDKLCGNFREEDYIELEAMLYAVDQINENQNLLPNIKLGVIAVDSCGSAVKALEEAIDFVKGFVTRDHRKNYSIPDPPFICEGNTLPIFESEKFEKVVAIIGAESSWVSKQLADVLKIFRVPQVSYLATNPALSRYEYFFRVVPPHNYEVRVIIEILKSFNWTYFAVVHSESLYGNTGLEYLKQVLKNETSLCISKVLRINVETSKDENYNKVMADLCKTSATAVVIFSGVEMARKVMSAATRSHAVCAHKRFVWIGSHGWGGTDPPVLDNEDVVEGAIAITHELKPFEGFEDYLKSRDLETHQETNPWFQEYWEARLNCRLKKRVDETTVGENFPSICPEDAKLPSWPSNPFKQGRATVQFVRDAVYSVAQALRNMYEEKCKYNKTCLKYHSMIGEELRNYLLEVKFEDENKEFVEFDEEHNGPYRYTIVNLQRVNGSNTLYWIPVGTYDRNREVPLKINRSLMIYKHHNPSFPESLCSAYCKKDQAKIPLDEASCCWHCKDCVEYQFVENGTQCKNCSIGEMPSNDRKSCEKIVSIFMDFSDSRAIGCIVFSSIGIITTLCTGGLVLKYAYTPVITSSGKEFSFILLVGIFLSFSLTFAVVSKPSDVSCSIVRFFLGFTYTISYASIAVRTRFLHNIISIEANEKPKAMNTRPLVMIALALIAAEGIINITWMCRLPPTIDYLDPYTPKQVLICKGCNGSKYLIGLVFPFFLLIFCNLYALKIRNFTGIFNESRYIAFTNYSSFIVWVAFLLIFFTQVDNSANITALSLSISTNAWVQLVCLFFPKLYIALLKPIQNKHDNSMAYDVNKLKDTGTQ